VCPLEGFLPGRTLLPWCLGLLAGTVFAQFLTQIVRLGRLLSMHPTSSAFSASSSSALDPFGAIVAASVASCSADHDLIGSAQPRTAVLPRPALDPRVPGPVPAFPGASGSAPGARQAPSTPGARVIDGIAGPPSPSGPGLLREFSPRSQTPNPASRRSTLGAHSFNATSTPLSHNRRMSTGARPLSLLSRL
jgi:hypothetical protein